MENKVLLSAHQKNEIFIKASKKEKRIMIAQDVLAQMNFKNILPTRGRYFDADNSSIVIPNSRKKTVELKEVLPKVGKCEVCAIGALFFSTVAINNNCKLEIDKYWDEHEVSVDLSDDILRERLRKCFSEYQIDLIEVAFESNNSYISTEYELNDKQLDEMEKALDFRKVNKAKTDSKALSLIMQNIINNDGTFKP